MIGFGRIRRAELAMTTHPPFNQAMERNYELKVTCTLHTTPAAALVEQHVSSPETYALVKRSSHSEFARLVAVAARVPLLPSKPLELLAVRVPHFGEHLGTCARVRARLRACTCKQFSSRTPSARVRRRNSAMSTPPWSSSTSLPRRRRSRPKRVSLQRIEFSSAMEGGDGAVSVQ